MKNVFIVLVVMVFLSVDAIAQKGYFENPEEEIQIEWVNKADFEASSETVVNSNPFSRDGSFHFVNNSGQPLLVKVGGERHELVDGQEIKVSSSEQTSYGLQVYQVSSAARYSEVYNQTISLSPGSNVVYEALPESN